MIVEGETVEPVRDVVPPGGLSIRVRILMACLVLTIITMALGTFTLWGEARLGDLALRMYDQSFMSVDFFRTAQRGFTAFQALPNRPEGGSEPRVQALRIVDDLDVAIERATSQEARAVATELRGIFLHFSTTDLDAETATEMMARAARLFELGGEQFAQDGFASRQQAEQIAKESKFAGRIAIGASLVAALLITFSLNRSIIPPLSRATSIATEIARGNLNNQIRPDGALEMVTLLSALHAMQAALVERRSAAEQIEHLAMHDVLTGLANRLHFARALSVSAAGARAFSLLLIDLDRFKPINDTFGHAVGDLLLQAAARRFEQCIGEGDLVARLGGDEFAILQPGAQRPQAEALARRVIEAVMQPYELENEQISIGCSVGIRCCDGSLGSDTLLRDADGALYAAKASGRNSFRTFGKLANTHRVELGV